MNICIIGDGLTGLSLAKNLINKKINVHIYCENRIVKIPKTRTIGLSKSNFDYFKKEIQDIPKKNFWKMENAGNKKLLKISIWIVNIVNVPLLNYILCFFYSSSPIGTNGD